MTITVVATPVSPLTIHTTGAVSNLAGLSLLVRLFSKMGTLVPSRSATL